MLFVKNMVFLDGAIARLAPDLDILAEIAEHLDVLRQRHGERLGRELGIDPSGSRWTSTASRPASASTPDRSADLPAISRRGGS